MWRYHITSALFAGNVRMTMAARSRTDQKVVDKTDAEVVAAAKELAKQTAPMVQRLASHRERFDLAIKELESERSAILSRRDHLRRQMEAVEAGFAIHLEDIEATLRMYEYGIKAGSA
ncbi:MAG TPA: hypothetical protein VGN60_11890 [Devosia sp.]|nr:hypothetical protein [Devosia sp.]